MRELRIAVRSLARQPGTAVLAIVALALGIGLTTTMFSIVNGAILRGLPFPESDRILHMAPFIIAEQDDVDAKVHTFAEFRDRQQSFEQLAAFQFQTANVVGADGCARPLSGRRRHRQHVPAVEGVARPWAGLQGRRKRARCRAGGDDRRQGVGRACSDAPPTSSASRCGSTARS